MLLAIGALGAVLVIWWKRGVWQQISDRGSQALPTVIAYGLTAAICETLAYWIAAVLHPISN